MIQLRDDLNNFNFVLLYAYNGTGKTRLSMAFKDYGRTQKKSKGADTLYFNAFTEDLFSWNNDLDYDETRFLKINPESKFFNGLKELSLDEKIRIHLRRYVDFDFVMDLDLWKISFLRNVDIEKRDNKGTIEKKSVTIDDIKISRGEENIFIWCFFLSLCELVIDKDESYSWVKYIYIDDPVSSLDDNNVIALASDLSQLLKRGKQKGESRVKVIISSHHGLFFNIMSNELKGSKMVKKILKKEQSGYVLQPTSATPFFHHVAILSELKLAQESGEIFTYHFNMLRSILEKTAAFFGYVHFSSCIEDIEDKVLYERALQLLSHGQYSIYEPSYMNEDNKKLFIDILTSFLDKYQFKLPTLFLEEINP